MLVCILIFLYDISYILRDRYLLYCHWCSGYLYFAEYSHISNFHYLFVVLYNCFDLELDYNLLIMDHLSNFFGRLLSHFVVKILYNCHLGWQMGIACVDNIDNEEVYMYIYKHPLLF